VFNLADRLTVVTLPVNCLFGKQSFIMNICSTLWSRWILYSVKINQKAWITIGIMQNISGKCSIINTYWNEMLSSLLHIHVYIQWSCITG